jgi:hypothetical protein
MRSIGPAGWASHGFFGFHAQTLGNPDGASSGGGAWQGVTNQGGDGQAAGLTPKGIRDGGANVNGPNQGGGGGPIPPPTGWVARTSPIPGGIFVAAASNLSGVTVALDVHNNVYRSTNGTTWPASTVSIASSTETLFLAWGDGVFIAISHTTGNLYRSADGITWGGAIASGLGANNASAIATDGAGNWVICSTVPGPTAISADNGLTWAISTGAALSLVDVLIWDGTIFVGASRDEGTNNSEIVSSANAGSSWDLTPIVNPGSNKFSPGLTVQSGSYVIGMNTPTPFVRTAPLHDPSSLVGPPNIAVPLVGQPFIIVSGNGVIWLFDLNGNVCASNTAGATWTAGTLNFTSGDFPGAAVHDAFNHLFIAFGENGGSISTVTD